MPSDWSKTLFTKAPLSFHYFLYYILISMLIIQYKITVMICFLLPFNLIFYISRSEYPSFKDFVIACHLRAIATLHKGIVTHTSIHLQWV